MRMSAVRLRTVAPVKTGNCSGCLGCRLKAVSFRTLRYPRIDRSRAPETFSASTILESQLEISCSSEYPRRFDRPSRSCNSLKEPNAISRNRRYSPWLSRAHPSTMFDGTETAAFPIWEVNPSISSLGNYPGCSIDKKHHFIPANSNALSFV